MIFPMIWNLNQVNQRRKTVLVVIIFLFMRILFTSLIAFATVIIYFAISNHQSTTYTSDINNSCQRKLVTQNECDKI